MLNTSNPIITDKARLLILEELCNVSKVCQVMSVSRNTFYRYQDLVETCGLNRRVLKETC